MPGPEDLVFSLCHEVGNLVGAIRLYADGIDTEASPVELASAAVEIDDSSARIRSWLALVRPLLGGELGDETGVSAEALVSGVAEALAELGARGVAVATEVGGELGRVRGRLETLHHLLATLAFHAVEAAQPDGAVRIAAEAAPGGAVAFTIDDDGRDDGSTEGAAAGAPTGRALAIAAAETILGRLDGDVEATREGDRTRVRLRLPLL